MLAHLLFQLLLLGARATSQVEPWCSDSIRVRINPGAPNPSATTLFDQTRGDYCMCLSAACNNSEFSSGYSAVRQEGWGVPAGVPNSIGLKVWYSHEHQDNLVATADFDVKSLGADYKEGVDNGYILTQPRTSSDRPLKLFLSPDRRHTITCARSATEEFARLHQYTLVKQLGYLCSTPDCGGGAPLGQPVLANLPGALIDTCKKTIQPRTSTTNGPVTSGNLQATTLQNGTIIFERLSDGRVLLFVDPPSVTPAAITETSSDMPFYAMGLRMRSGPSVGIGEKIFGLGQIEGTKNTWGCDGDGNSSSGLPLSRNGQTFDLSVHKFHVSIPLAVSNRGYGFLLNLPGAGAVKVSQDGRTVEWSVTQQPQMDFWVTTTGATNTITSDATTSPAGTELGATTSPLLGDIYTRYAEATGKAPLLPSYAAGFWQSRLRYRSQEEALTVARRFGALNISLGVFVIDFFNQAHDGDFHMNQQCYPDIQGMSDGVKAATNATLMVSFWTDMSPTADAHDALQKAGCLCEHGSRVDPSMSACREMMWRDYVKPNYYDKGVGAFWLDETDFMTSSAVGSADYVGRMWTNWWIQTFSEGYSNATSATSPLILTRGLWAGAQRYGVVLWSSDVWSTFNELQAQMIEGVHASLSGIPWWTSDVGGFGCPTSPHNNTSPYMQELIVRWYQFGVVSPIFRTHGCRAGQSLPVMPSNSPCIKGQGPQGSCGPNEIWSYGPVVQPILTKYVHLRNKVLKPYILELAANVTALGVPTVRPCWWDFPNDLGAHNVSIEQTQFMLGPRYLAAPVTVQGATTKEVYFPGGKDTRWINWETGVEYAGGTTRSVPAPLDHLPLFERK